jgi:hypothetical protein
MKLNLYPDLADEDNFEWYYSQIGANDNNEGYHLMFLYYFILTHLQNSYLDKPNFLSYFSNYFLFNHPVNVK